MIVSVKWNLVVEEHLFIVSFLSNDHTNLNTGFGHIAKIRRKTYAEKIKRWSINKAKFPFDAVVCWRCNQCGWIMDV